MNGQATANGPDPRRRVAALLGTLLIAAAIATLGAATQTRAAAEDDPLAMFTEMMPVWTSPRCVNCHGATIPDVMPEGQNHEGGLVDVVRGPSGDATFDGSGTCQGCHDGAPPSWRLAPARMSLVDKDAETLCRQMRKVNSLSVAANREQFNQHLHNDFLIDIAFVGNRGISDVEAAPPPMSREAFFAAAQRWLDNGLGACSNKWSGTITETTTASETATFAPAPGKREVTTQSLLTITVDENEATAAVQWELKDFTDVPTKDCQTFAHHTFSASGTQLPISVTIAMNPALPAGGLTMPELPPGITLPPGSTLPGGGAQARGLPPGVSLPPGITLPSLAAGGYFIQYTPTERSEVGGTHHSDLQTTPGCRRDVKDERHAYTFNGAQIDTTPDPNDPNHLAGEKVIEGKNTKTVIKWDLRRAGGADE
jgi:hypothetical protein